MYEPVPVGHSIRIYIVLKEKYSQNCSEEVATPYSNTVCADLKKKNKIFTKAQIVHKIFVFFMLLKQ